MEVGKVETFPRVQGKCPRCGGNTLFLASGGYVTCGYLICPEPEAASKLLEGKWHGK